MSGWLQDEVTLRDLPVSFILGTLLTNIKAKTIVMMILHLLIMVIKGAISITPTDWLMLYTLTQAFRAPTLGEMYNDAKHFDAPFLMHQQTIGVQIPI